MFQSIKNYFHRQLGEGTMILWTVSLGIAVGWGMCLTFNTLDRTVNLSWITVPVAIFFSSSITIIVTYIGWVVSRRTEVTNRTISFCQEAMSTPLDVLNHLDAAQDRIKNTTDHYVVLDKDNGTIDFHIDIFISDLIKHLTKDESSALHHYSRIQETICLNLEYGYFSEKVVRAHFGDNFELSFWLKTWPFLIYAKQLQREDMDHFSNMSSYCSSLEQRIYNNEDLNNKFQVDGTTQDDSFSKDSLKLVRAD
jgi:hypothetical protein